MGGVLTRAAWNDRLTAINILAANPTGPGCSAKTALPLVGPKHVWRKADITAARDRLVEVCADNTGYFVEDNPRWDIDYLWELSDGVMRGWCDCGPAILATWYWPVQQVTVGWTQPWFHFFGFGPSGFNEISSYPHKIDVAQLAQDYVIARYGPLEYAFGVVRVYREHLDNGGTIQAAQYNNHFGYTCCDILDTYGSSWTHNFDSPSKFGAGNYYGPGGSVCAGGPGHASEYEFPRMCYEIEFYKYGYDDPITFYLNWTNYLYKDYQPIVTLNYTGPDFTHYQSQILARQPRTQWRIEITSD